MPDKRITTPRHAGIGGHQTHRAGTVEWLTPPEIIEALGPFDLDPCAPVFQPWPTARRVFTKKDNGLIQDWREDRVWLNPPYSRSLLRRFLARMAEHQHGTALIFARTETEPFYRYVWESADGLLFIKGRLNFRTPDGGFAFRKDGKTPANAGAPSVLIAYGRRDLDVLAACEIDGKFVPLRLPVSVLMSIFPASNEGEKIDITWPQAVAGFFAARPEQGPVHLDELYRHFAAHPKATKNQHVEEKVRQTLQRGPYRNVGRGLWQQERAP